MRTISILPNLWRRFPEPVPATNVNPENQYVNLVSFLLSASNNVKIKIAPATPIMRGGRQWPFEIA
ncbi:hypothetical protein HED54_24880 [Ochrobactrum anthropi ATCC 49188]|nr:hypothetical protein [Brucella anthropi ATCC 49188]